MKRYEHSVIQLMTTESAEHELDCRSRDGWEHYQTSQGLREMSKMAITLFFRREIETPEGPKPELQQLVDPPFPVKQTQEPKCETTPPPAPEPATVKTVQPQPPQPAHRRRRGRPRKST